MSKTKLKLTNRGWNIVGILGGIGFAGIIILSGFMEAAL